MRIALVAHGLPPLERTGVENHVADLAAELARRGHEVHVLAPRRHARLPELALRTEVRGACRVHWLARNEPPRSAGDHLVPDGVETAFSEWLERERPDVVHVHHFAKLGLGVLRAARAAELPLVFTAHDYLAICHRTTMLRPDLARCEKLADAEACARCDLAAAGLNRRKELGDYQAGVFPVDLGPAARRELEATLADDLASPRARATLEERRALDERRLDALRAVDLVLSPSAFVAERLVGAGLARERVVHEPLGVDVGALAAVGPPRSAGALRLGFVGSTSKHKGLHVLLEALEGLGPRVRLAVWGESSDRRWEARLRERAARLEASWHGGFDASDRARVFASFDVLCVPSIWDENAPLVIREAFAAGRPVLASRVGALGESVRDGVDGRLVAPGDAAAWREVIAGWIRDRAPLAALGGGVRAPRTLAEEADATLAHYERLRAGRAGARPTPASLVAFRERQAALAREPFEALVERVARGLERFGAALGPAGASGFASLVRGPAARDVLDRARDARRERQWLARTLDRRKDARAEAARLARRERELADRLAREHERSGAEHAALVVEREALIAEREALAAAKSAADAELARLSAHADVLRAELAHGERERATLADALGRAQEALRRAEDLLRAAADDRGRVGEHAEWLERRVRELAREAGGEAPELDRNLDALRARLAELARELAWRRDEMRAALADKRGWFGRGELAERLARWRAGADGGTP